MTRGERAEALFMEGYSCAQAVTLAFSDIFNVDEKTLALMTSSFGGGIGRMREVCGAFLGMTVVAGLKNGYFDPKDFEKKKEHYALIQTLADAYRKETGSILCYELLGISKDKITSVPEKRTSDYYKKRPCPKLCNIAASITAKILQIGDCDGK